MPQFLSKLACGGLMQVFTRIDGAPGGEPGVERILNLKQQPAVDQEPIDVIYQQHASG